MVLVGPAIKVDPATLPKRPNLHFLGQRPYADLPAYLKGFDVCLMPWALNDATRTISPTKTLEYMAVGKPIVSTAVRDVVRDHGDLVRIADDPADFVALMATSSPSRSTTTTAPISCANGPTPTAGTPSPRRCASLIEAKRPARPAAPRKARKATHAGDAKNLIVGGGPAGLSAALHLDDPDFLLAEKHARTGGLCRSIVQDGFTFDYAGHIFFTQRTNTSTASFATSSPGNFHEQLRESWVYLYDAYQRYPFQGNLFGLPPAVVKECLLGVIDASRHASPTLNGQWQWTRRAPGRTSWNGRTGRSAPGSPSTS